MPKWPSYGQSQRSGQWPGGAAASSFPVIQQWPVAEPAQIIERPSIKDYWRADLGVTIGTGASAWHGQVVGLDFAQATGSAQPTRQATNASFNNQTTLLFDGVDDVMATTINVGSGTYIWAVLRQITWTANRLLMSAGAGASVVIYQWAGSTSPNITQFNGSNANSNPGATLGTGKTLEAWFGNSTTDFVATGSSVVSGQNAGSASDTTFYLGGFSGGSCGNIELAEVMLLSVLPTRGQRNRLLSYAALRYGRGFSQ